MTAVASHTKGPAGHQHRRPPHKAMLVPRSEMTESGTIRWFDGSRHYGFIIPDDHDSADVFLHESVLKKYRIRPDLVDKDVRVFYKVRIQSNGKPEAIALALDQ
jgi:cold shock CspA family protein